MTYQTLTFRWKTYLQSIRLGGFCGFQGEEPSTLRNIAENQENWAASHPSGGPCSTLQSPTPFQYHSVPLDVFWLSPRHRGILGKRGGTRSSQSPSAVLPQVPLILLGGLALGYHNSCAAMVGDMDRLVTQWILTAPKQCIEVMVVTSNPCLIYTTWNGPKNFNISSWRS